MVKVIVIVFSILCLGLAYAPKERLFETTVMQDVQGYFLYITCPNCQGVVLLRGEQ